MKTCTKCSVEKELEDFYVMARGKFGRAAACKECTRNSAAQKAPRPGRQGSKLKARYGITQKEYDAMHEEQDGKCAICQKECSTGRSLAVDHDHVTNEVRALLCMDCNTGIGKFQDDPDKLLDAVAYLMSYKKVVF